jgi:hypothetical protein
MWVLPTCKNKGKETASAKEKDASPISTTNHCTQQPNLTGRLTNQTNIILTAHAATTTTQLIVSTPPAPAKASPRRTRTQIKTRTPPHRRGAVRLPRISHTTPPAPPRPFPFSFSHRLRRNPTRPPFARTSVPMEDFARAVEDGLKLSKRLVLPGGVPPPRPPTGMHRTPVDAPPDAVLLLPSAPTAYAVASDPASVDTPDVPSYQPYVYGRLDPPALIPLQVKEVDLAVDCALDVATVTLRARWWLHCITRSRECDVRLVVPMGEQVSWIGSSLLCCPGFWHLTFSFLLSFVPLTRIVGFTWVGCLA